MPPIDERRWPWMALALCLAALVFGGVDIAWHYDRLPPRVASHFDGEGRPNGWCTKQQLVGMLAAITTMVTVSVAAILPIVSLAPASLINLPHRDYWLAPEREQATRRAIVDWGAWFLAATLWLLALVFHDTIAANFRQPPQTRGMGWLVGGYLALTFVMVLWLLARFWRLPAEEPASHPSE